MTLLTRATVEAASKMWPKCTVGRTPWSAADALVGLPQWTHDISARAERPARGPAADQGVRPTWIHLDPSGIGIRTHYASQRSG